MGRLKIDGWAGIGWLAEGGGKGRGMVGGMVGDGGRRVEGETR